MKSIQNMAVTMASAVMLGALTTAPVLADDIEVFSTGVSIKPNILFVFDRSGSMDLDVNGNNATNWDDRRSSILRQAFSELLTRNKDKINAGMGPFYRERASGVKWPIGDLNQDASDIDSSIPAANGLTSGDIMDRLFDSSGDWGSTNIVDALYQSLLYYRGDSVRAGGGSWDGRFRPDVWNVANNRFEGGDDLAPHPASYSPQNAFAENSVSLPDESGSCRDFSIGGTVIGNNECENSSYTRYDSCSYVAEQTGSGSVCTDSEYTCFSTNVDGQCVDGEWNCKTTAPASGTPAHNQCTWYREDRFGPSWSGADYISPIADSCQVNAIVLLSDGDPTYSSASEEIKTLTGDTSCEDLSTSIFSSADPSDANDGDCGIELVKFANETDQISTIPNSTVSTYTIGFGVPTPGQDYLKRLAEEGGGEFHAATDADQLSDAFDRIIDSIAGDAETFTALAVDVNKASFSHDNRAFFSLFAPSGKRSWQGNLKGYFLNSAGLADVDGNPAITDLPGGSVFAETSRSFWSPGIDGNDVVSGGAASRLDPTNRNLYTFTGTNIPAGGADLTDVNHALVGTNTQIKSAMLQGQDRTVVDWVRTAPIADPLHTQPITIEYENRTVVYMMTNQGLLHAFDATSPTIPGDHLGGSELWAFMPQALLSNIPELKADLSTGGHIYGLDGGMTRWLDESGNVDGVIQSGENATLYLGMRRGGSHYYAIDVSNPLKPKLKWRIDAGSNSFKRLGQTWSRMSLVTMDVQGSAKKVMVFGGGYDETLDGSTSRVSVDATGNTVKGNDIYLVDAEDGSLLWSANNLNTNTAMRYAIPSDVNVIDSNGDGLADRAYVGDLGGQIWRLDFKQGQIKSSGGVTVTRLAELGSDTSFQPFFYPPSVSLIRSRGNDFLSVAIGSGSRDNPLNASSENAVFMVKDSNTATGAPVTTAGLPIIVTDLHNATLNPAGSSDDTVSSAAYSELSTKDGWYIKLADGEKVLARTNVLQNELHLTTFSPDSSGVGSTDPCVAAGTTGRYYRMDISDARPVDNLDQAIGDTDDTPLTIADRSRIISNHGIPGPVTMVFPEGSQSIQVYVDKQKVSDVPQQLVNVLWYDNR